MSAGATLYGIPGSHAVRAAALMLEHKGVPYRRRDFIPGFHSVAVRALGFPGGTVPALRIDRRRAQPNREIARALDELHPDPPLLPAAAATRAAVEEAERFGDEVLQPAARRLVIAAAIHRGMDELADGADSGPLGALLAPNRRRRLRLMRIAGRRVLGVTGEREREDREGLPAQLDRVDGWIANGVLGGERLNVADCMIAPSVCLLAYVLDLWPVLEGRPAQALAERLIPSNEGTLPAPLVKVEAEEGAIAEALVDRVAHRR